MDRSKWGDESIHSSQWTNEQRRNMMNEWMDEWMNREKTLNEKYYMQPILRKEKQWYQPTNLKY